VDDVGDFQDLVHQGDVAVREVHRGTGGGGEVVVSPDGRGDDQVVDDLTIDFGNHLIGHEVGEGALGVDVVDRLEVLGGLQLQEVFSLRVIAATESLSMDRVTSGWKGLASRSYS
jgi:hypothetical protein